MRGPRHTVRKHIPTGYECVCDFLADHTKRPNGLFIHLNGNIAHSFMPIDCIVYHWARKQKGRLSNLRRVHLLNVPHCNEEWNRLHNVWLVFGALFLCRRATKIVFDLIVQITSICCCCRFFISRELATI